MTAIDSLDFTTDNFGTRYQYLVSSFARPNDSNAYQDMDVMSSTAAAARSIIFLRAGKSGFVHNASIMLGATVSVGFDLLLFDSEPTNQTDNAALALVAGDMPKMIYRYSFLDADKLTVGTGINFYRPTIGISTTQYTGPHAFHATTGNIYGLLVVRGTPTVTANTKVLIRLSIERDE